MSQEFRREYLLRLPLPLAHLYGAAYNAKDPRQRHDNAFYLCEALVKLAAAPLVAAYLDEAERGGPRVGALDRLLAQLALPSLGQWVAMLRELARHFGRRPDASSHPFGGAAGRLDAPRDLPGLTALYRRIKNGPDGQPAGDQGCSPMQIFDALVQYRNGVFGHGGPRFAAFFEREMGPLLFPAVNDLLAEGVVDPLGPGGRLVTITELNILEDGRVAVGLRELSGLRGERAAPLVLAAEAAAALAPDRVALLRPGGAAPLRLDPLLVYREGELVEEVLFLNRDRNGRQVEYLSYTTGRAERDKTMAPALAALLSRVTGRPVGEDELQALAEQSRAEAPSVEALFAVPPAPEARLGDFELLGELGRGGMGVVYLARQLSLGRLVALKMLPGDLSADATALARFQREIRALARCDHPHIVKVLASGALPDGRLYYAMEYVPGCDLEHVWRELSGAEGREAASRLGGTSWARAVLSASRKRREQTTGRGADPTVADKGETKKPLPLPPLPELPSAPDDPGGYVRRVAALVRDAASALQTVHDHHLVHRDVKPANLMLTPDGSRVVLMDFGLAKGESAALTDSRQGGLLGTLRYAAPEQLAAANVPVGPAADVRGLGVTLWELLTRRRLFGDAADEAQLAQRVLTEDVPRLRRMDRTLDRDLEAIAARATERNAADRIPTACRLAEYLQLYLDGKPLPIRPPGPAERAARWVRRRPAAAALLTLLALLLVGATGGGWWYYDRYVRVHVDYYAAWTKRWGAYEGHGRLTADQTQNRPYSYKFYTRAGRVERVDVVDWRGELTSRFPPLHYMDALEPGGPLEQPNQANRTPRRECYYKFERDDRGRVTDEIVYDRNDAVVLHFHYSSPTTGEFTDGNGYPSAKSNSGAAFVEFKWDKEGRETECLFRDNARRPRPDAQGAYGLRREWDDKHFVRRVTLLDEEGRPFQTNNGYATVEYERDGQGNVAAVRYYKADGVRTRHRDGYAEIRSVWDSYGRIREQTYLDLAGNPVRSRYGAVRLQWTYAAPDEWVGEYLDGDGRPDPQWGGVVKMKQENVRRDASGRTLRLTFLDASDRPTRATSWEASLVEVDDPDGRPLEKSYFGPHGEPTYTRDGPAREVKKYDGAGNVILWEGYDAEGALMRGASWYARRKCIYDDRQRLTEESYEGPDGKPALNKDGYALRRITNDADGKVTEEEFFDADGAPTRRRDGYSRYAQDYDSLGRYKEMSYYGPDKNPTWSKQGYASLRTVKDARGNSSSVTSLAPDGKPVIGWNGVCEIRREYDDWGDWTREAYFGADNKPLAANGVAFVERTLDRLGNPLATSNFGLNGEKVLGGAGFWQERDEYDDRGWLTHRTYRGLDGAPQATPESTAEVWQKNDAHGEPTEFLYRGADGKPALQDGRYARYVRTYDDCGLITAESFYGLSLTDPVDGGKGYARAEQKLDPRGRVASRRFFGPDGMPCRNSDGAFGVDRVYDDRGLCVEETFVDGEGKPLLATGRYCKVKTAFDARGNPTEQRFFGVHGELVARPAGFALARTAYDGRDNKTSVHYFGPDGAACRVRDGYAAADYLNNDCDEILEEAFYGPDQRLKVVPTRGYAKMRHSYTSHGFEETAEYYGADDRLMNGPKGYARIVVARDDADKQTGATYFDRDGRRLRRTVVLKTVEAGSAGDQKGLKPGDVLIRYDGLEIVDMAHFVTGRAGEGPGGEHILGVRRGDKELEFRVSPGPLSIQMREAFLPAAASPDDKPGDGAK